MKYQSLIGILALSLLLYCGGKPSRGTSADRRLAVNKPKPAIVKPTMPAQPKKGGNK